jgi:hypothetical protein
MITNGVEISIYCQCISSDALLKLNSCFFNDLYVYITLKLNIYPPSKKQLKMNAILMSDVSHQTANSITINDKISAMLDFIFILRSSSS